MTVDFLVKTAPSHSSSSTPEPAYKALANLLTRFYKPAHTEATSLSKRVVTVLQSSNAHLATQVFRAVWELSGRPEGDPIFGERAFFADSPIHEHIRRDAIASALNALRDSIQDLLWAVTCNNEEATTSALQALEALSPETAWSLFGKMYEVSSNPSKNSDPEFGRHAFQNPATHQAEKISAIESILIEASATPLQLLSGAIKA